MDQGRAIENLHRLVFVGAAAVVAAGCTTGDVEPATDGGITSIESEPVRCANQCVAMAPGATPEQTRADMQWCLNHCEVTSLKANEVFKLHESVIVPSGKTLTT